VAVSLPWVGYRALRVGKIHVYCLRCGRRFFNAPRYETDPPSAELVRTLCDRCGTGCKEAPEHFLDGRGRRVYGEL
jgi:ribosomal protein L37E